MRVGKSVKKRILRLCLDKLEDRNIFVTRKRHPNDFMLSQRIQACLIKNSPDVLHIGAHIGQEAPFYAECDAGVIWIEANPNSIQELEENISKFSGQKAFNLLLGKQTSSGIPFFIATNEGASSSIFTFRDSENTGSPKMSDVLILDMFRLDDVFDSKDLETYRHWVLDVQGAEIEVLEGAGKLLSVARSILVESKRYSEYKGGANWDDLLNFLKSRGFQNMWNPIENEEDNILFIRNNTSI